MAGMSRGRSAFVTGTSDARLVFNFELSPQQFAVKSNRKNLPPVAALLENSMFIVGEGAEKLAYRHVCLVQVRTCLSCRFPCLILDSFGRFLGGFYMDRQLYSREVKQKKPGPHIKTSGASRLFHLNCLLGPPPWSVLHLDMQSISLSFRYRRITYLLERKNSASLWRSEKSVGNICTS